MREIKFRVWDKDLKKFVTGDGYDYGISLTGDLIYEIFGYDEGDFNRPSIDYILMQYTGLKDKNGKEIYEGDIVRTSYGLYRRPTVIDDLESWYFNRVEFSWSSADMEVLGNIYENPELLEDK